MATALVRRLHGLVRPLSAALCSRPTSLCHPTAVSQPARLLHLATGPGGASNPCAAACLPSRWGILQWVSPLIPSLLQPPSRCLTYFSIKKGKKKSVRSVTERFLRLHCGLWLRRKAGYKKKLWRKKPARKKRLREHVFCNKTQSKLLDKMTASFWRRRNWYLDDPYLKYHDRVNLKV